MAMNVTGIEDKVATIGVNMAGDFVSALVALVVFVIVLALGYVVAWAAVFILKKILEAVKLEQQIKDAGLNDALLGFNITTISTILLRLFVLILFVGIAADLVQVKFLSSVASWALGYIPALTEGVAIMVVVLLAGEYVTERMKKAKIPFANSVAIAAEVFIAYNGLVIALPLVLPNASVVLLADSFRILIIGVVAALGLGTAIALGWGLKDTVADIAKKKRAKIEELF